MNSIQSIWSWCLATPQNATVTLAVAGFVFNCVVRFFASKEWGQWCEGHPRVSGLFLIAKGLFPEGSTILRGIVGAITGELRERASGKPVATKIKFPALTKSELVDTTPESKT